VHFGCWMMSKRIDLEGADSLYVSVFVDQIAAIKEHEIGMSCDEAGRKSPIMGCAVWINAGVCLTVKQSYEDVRGLIDGVAM